VNAELITHVDTRVEFSEEASIHIYSLEPGPLEVWPGRNTTGQGLITTEPEHIGSMQPRSKFEVYRQGSTTTMASIWIHSESLHQGNGDPFARLGQKSRS
jgi:hypothetical protein